MHEPDDEQTDLTEVDGMPVEDVATLGQKGDAPVEPSADRNELPPRDALASEPPGDAATDFVVTPGEVVDAAAEQPTADGEPSRSGSSTVTHSSSTAYMTTTTTTTRVAGEVATTETTTTTRPVTAPYAGPSGSFPRPVG